MANPLLPKQSTQQGGIFKDIQDANSSGHQDMTFTLNDANQTIIPFKLNPQQLERIRQPLQVKVPTNTGFYVFRWQILPTAYQFSAYCGLAGKSMELLIDQLVGQSDILWSFPYLNRSARVRIDDVRTTRSSDRPYASIYQITMQENIPLVKVTQGKITQTRINSSFLAPTTYNPSAANTPVIGHMPVDTSWKSLTDAVQAVFAKVPNIPFQTQYNLMSNALNPNMFKTSKSPTDRWDKQGGPTDNAGNHVTQINYVVSIGTGTSSG